MLHWFCSFFRDCDNPRLTVYLSDGVWKETVLASGCFGAQCPVTMTGGKELEQAVRSLQWFSLPVLDKLIPMILSVVHINNFVPLLLDDWTQVLDQQIDIMATEKTCECSQTLLVNSFSCLLISVFRWHSILNVGRVLYPKVKLQHRKDQRTLTVSTL